MLLKQNVINIHGFSERNQTLTGIEKIEFLNMP